MSDPELPSWVLKHKGWKTCTFRGFGLEKKAYLDLLTKRMVEKGFSHIENFPTCGYWDSLVARNSDLLFSSSGGKVRIGIRALLNDGNLRVGFADVTGTKKKICLLFASSIFVAIFLSYLTAYMTSRVINVSERPEWMLPTLIVFFAALSIPILYYGAIPRMRWRQRVKAALIETAESMGGKQITSFKQTTVELED